jgi:hypothetical protein
MNNKCEESKLCLPEATFAEKSKIFLANELELFIENLLKDKPINDNIDFTEIDNIVEEILNKNIIKQSNNMFDRIQVKKVEHKPDKIKECIVS